MNREELFAKLCTETARIKWVELERYFAGGVLLWVAEELDLVETAVEMAINNTSQTGQWMEQGLLAPMPTDKAKQYLEQDPALWAVVVAPWVLVQCKE